MTDPDPTKRCNPIEEFDSPQTIWESIYALIGLYAGCYLISLCIMLKLSRKYE